MDFPTAYGSNAILASALVGALMPAAIAVVTQRDWPAETKGLVAAALCLAAAALVAYTQSALDATDLLRSFLIVFTLAQILYQAFWKPSGIAPAIKARSSSRWRKSPV